MFLHVSFLSCQLEQQSEHDVTAKAKLSERFPKVTSQTVNTRAAAFDVGLHVRSIPFSRTLLVPFLFSLLQAESEWLVNHLWNLGTQHYRKRELSHALKCLTRARGVYELLMAPNDRGAQRTEMDVTIGTGTQLQHMRVGERGSQGELARAAARVIRRLIPPLSLTVSFACSPCAAHVQSSIEAPNK